MSRRIRAGAAAALAAALAATLALAGCTTWFEAPQLERTSTPTGETVEPELERFYHQVLEWEGCGDGMQCSSAIAPLDWDAPEGETIELALSRHPATGEKRGSLLVNPGGPGGSGYDFVLESADQATSSRLQSGFDVVGFDPRGVGRSTPVSCHDDPAEFDDYVFGVLPGVRGSDAWIERSEEAARRFGERCLELTGPLLEHVDTASAARDLDMLRAALGDEELDYLGYSYGTFLGATYAEMFPERTGRLVFDGALDPSTSEAEVTLTQATGFESAFTAYLESCVDRSDCPFRGSVDEALDQTGRLLERLALRPLSHSDGRQLGSGTMFTAIILPLYNRQNWAYLDALFAEVPKGQTETAFALADTYYDREPSGEYASNSTEALGAINCLDYPADGDVASMRAAAEELVEAAPVFGPQLTFGGIGCGVWPFLSERERGPIEAAGSSDILVLGTTNDPATPYVWAERLAEQLQNGHLVTYEGEGHTAYNKSNECVNDAVDDFLLEGVVPESDPRC